MHPVYKLDHLFESTRVSDENSSVSKAFLFSMCRTKHKVSPAYSPTMDHECKHINAPSDVCRESEWFVFGRWNECRTWPRGGLDIGNDKPDPTVDKPDPTTQKALERNTRSVCFFLIGRGELKETKRLKYRFVVETGAKDLSDFICYFWTQKRLKLGMVSSFYHNMCAKVERVTIKTGCTSCTNWTISFKVQGFQTKTHLFQRHFIFLNLFQLKTFSRYIMKCVKNHYRTSWIDKWPN